MCQSHLMEGHHLLCARHHAKCWAYKDKSGMDSVLKEQMCPTEVLVVYSLGSGEPLSLPLLSRKVVWSDFCIKIITLAVCEGWTGEEREWKQSWKLLTKS